MNDKSMDESIEKNVPMNVNESNANDDIETRFVKKLQSIPCAGFVIAVLSAVFFATASLLVKLVPSVNAVEVVVSR